MSKEFKVSLFSMRHLFLFIIEDHHCYVYRVVLCSFLKLNLPKHKHALGQVYMCTRPQTHPLSLSLQISFSLSHAHTLTSTHISRPLPIDTYTPHTHTIKHTHKHTHTHTHTHTHKHT